MPQPGPTDASRQAPAALAADGCPDGTAPNGTTPNGTTPTPRPRPVPGRRPSPGPRPTPSPRAGGESPQIPVPEPVPAVESIPLGANVATEIDPNVELAEEIAKELDQDLVELEATGAVPEGDQVAIWALVRRAQDGDAEAFGEIYDHYVTMVHRYVYHRVGDRSFAEDVTSETFVRALRRIDSLSFQGRDVGAWLVTIARNIIRDHVKSSRYRLEVTTADMRDADRATDGPEDAVVQQLTNEQLLACVKQLGSEQQECISLRFLQGLSVSETAAIMGKKDGAIKALQHRAVRRLAGLLPEGLR